MSLLENPSYFGAYRLSSRIATGGMAEVYLGRRSLPSGSLGPAVAVKRLLPHLVHDTQIVRMFLNEAQITAQIHHPNVVKILEVGQVDAEPFIAMELLEGRSFAELRQQSALAGRRIPLGITLRVLTESCRGLDAAHRAKDSQGRKLSIVHRDFTPDNIHVGVAGDVKVIDFGIAKAENLGAGTEPGTLKGKFFYMSPEMIAGRQVDHRADLFAAAVILYESLCGRRPFTGNNTDEVIHRIAEGKPRPPTEFDPSVPRGLEAICLKALSKNPEDRFSTLSEMISEIEGLGGAAELATREQLGAYVSWLFPVEEDPKRRILRQALQADPSQPSARALQRSNGAPAAPVAAPEPSPAPVPEPPREQAAEPAPKSRRPLPLKTVVIAAGSVALLAGAAIGVWTLSGPKKTPAQLIADAEHLTDAHARTRVLDGIEEAKEITAEQLARAAELELAVGEAEAALRIADAGTTRYPSSLPLQLSAARSAISLRKGRRAEQAISKAQALAPGDAQPDVLLADLREAQGDSTGAIEAISRARKHHPEDVRLAVREGGLLSQAGRLDDADKALSDALERRFDAGAAAELGFVRFRQEKYDAAQGLLRKATRRDPGLFKAHYYLGAVLFRQGDAKGAEREYRDADAIDPKDPRAVVALCQMVAALHDDARASQLQADIQKRFPADAKALTAQCK